MEINIYVSKFSRLVQRIFEEKYELSRYYAENLLKHLNDKHNSVVKVLLSTPMLSDLIFHSFGNLQNLSTQNKIFIVEVMTTLVKNELQFNRFQSQGLKPCLLNRYMKLNMESVYPSMDLHYAFIQLATASLCHISGLKSIVRCKSWEYILFPDTHLKPCHVARACYEFITQLVLKLDDFEKEDALTEVLDFVILPIKMSAYQTLTVFDQDNERCISEPIITPLNTLLHILNDMPRLLKCKLIVPSLKMMFFVKAPLYKILAGSRDYTVVCLVSEINFRARFAMVAKVTARDGKTESDLLNTFLANFLNQVNYIISKRMVPILMGLIVKANIFWAKTGSKMCTSTFERGEQTFQIEDQLIVLALVPILTYLNKSYMHVDVENTADNFEVKMLHTMTEHIIKSFYTYKMIIEDLDLKMIVIQSIRELLRLKGLLKAAQAGLVFQSLYYVLKLYLLMDEEEKLVHNSLKASDDVKLLSLVLECMKMLLVEHNIHWYENVEIITLQNSLMNLLKLTLPTKQLQQVFDLIDLSVKKFLSPDMNLLVESKRGSTLDEIVTILKSYIQHKEWEVRESALSLLMTCIDIAFVKYAPLQKLISENGLLLLASHAAFNDPEYYVQCTALRCLAFATRIEGIWRELLASNSYVSKQLIYLLTHCPEGMVRKESAEVLVNIYVNQRTSLQFDKAMYMVMSSAALDDLHWEVQITALYFWMHIIKKRFSDKGMIDGKFPKVTFSKEKRKIVVLDEREVKKQLSIILNDLSDIGCLTVLHRCLNDDNTEVMALANRICTKLMNILNYHGFDKCPENTNQPVQPMDEAIQEIKHETDEDMILDFSFVPVTEAMRDQIIDDIVSTKMEDLIINLKEKNYANGINVDKQIQIPPKKVKIHPDKFIEDFKKIDYENLIKCKNNWHIDIQTLDVLLDEILER